MQDKQNRLVSRRSAVGRIGTKNVSETDLTPRMKYIMVRIDN